MTFNLTRFPWLGMIHMAQPTNGRCIIPIMITRLETTQTPIISSRPIQITQPLMAWRVTLNTTSGFARSARSGKEHPNGASGAIWLPPQPRCRATPLSISPWAISPALQPPFLGNLILLSRFLSNTMRSTLRVMTGATHTSPSLKVPLLHWNLTKAGWMRELKICLARFTSMPIVAKWRAWV